MTANAPSRITIVGVNENQTKEHVPQQNQNTYSFRLSGQAPQDWISAFKSVWEKTQHAEMQNATVSVQTLTVIAASTLEPQAVLAKLKEIVDATSKEVDSFQGKIKNLTF